MYPPPSYDNSPAMGDYYNTIDSLEARRMQETLALEQVAACPDRFHEYKNTLTPPIPPSPMAAYYTPGINEPPSPTVMGNHTQAFAEEMNLPFFEHEDHRITSLEDNEYLSTIPPQAINSTPQLQGMYTNEFARTPALLTEPVPMDPVRFPGEYHHETYPVGAVDCVARSEVEENYYRYGRVGAEHFSEEYVANKEADFAWSPPESAFWTYAPERGL